MTQMPTPMLPIVQRIDTLLWPTLRQTLETQGFVTTGQLLSASECQQLIDCYAQPQHFRSRIKMQQYRFGQGEYQYFAYPLPDLVQALRESVYPHLSPIANAWNELLAQPFTFPNTLAAYLATCHQAAQRRPTPLLLKYQPGDFNCLHQDLYGEQHFPLQMAIVLSQPIGDFSGGEFVLVEQRPRSQSRAHVVPLQQGEAIIFAVSHRPVQGTRGHYRVNLKHGVSTLHSGQRYCLGVIFHDAT
jgi:uncharacterized protein